MSKRTKTNIIIKDEAGNIIKNLDGRPSVMTPQVLTKLEEAFMNCFSDEEACIYAGISPRSLYRYQAQNEGFRQRKELLRLTPNMHAKKELVTGIKGNLDQARWWAQNKMSHEFGQKAPAPIALTQINIESMNLGKDVLKAITIFNGEMRKQLTAKPEPQNV